MGLYNFQKRFVPMIEDGSKCHTIRACRRCPDKPGDTLHLYTGLRQPGARLLFRAPCVRIENIRIDRARVWINDNELSLDEKDILAWHDGFRYDGTMMEICDPPVAKSTGCFNLMLQFWVEKHRTTEFIGHIIHWHYEQRSKAEGR
jgi:hypothetical protein